MKKRLYKRGALVLAERLAPNPQPLGRVEAPTDAEDVARRFGMGTFLFWTGRRPTKITIASS
jgi:hypothetical protein